MLGVYSQGHPQQNWFGAVCSVAYSSQIFSAQVSQSERQLTKQKVRPHTISGPKYVRKQIKSGNTNTFN
jgi:hypothetical protein